MDNPKKVGGRYDTNIRTYTKKIRVDYNPKVKKPYKIVEKTYYHPLSYFDIGARNWIDPTQYIPYDLDLVEVKLSNGTYGMGWISGYEWCVRKLKKGITVVGWRRSKDYDDHPN